MGGTTEILDITSDEHRALVDFPSISELGLFSRSPFFYKRLIKDKAKPKETSSRGAKRKGTLFHLLLLEPMEYAEKVILLPEDYNGRTKEGKALKAEIDEKEKQGFFYIDLEEHNEYQQAAKRIYEIPELQKMIEETIHEKTILFHPDNKTKCKARLDAFSVEKNYILDLKTTASVKDFSDSIVKFNYAAQAAFYVDAFKALYESEPKFYWLAIELSTPYEFRLLTPSEQTLEVGRSIYRRYLEEFSKCSESDTWPDQYKGIEEVSVPQWVINRELGVCDF